MNPQLFTEARKLANLSGTPTSGLCAIVMAVHECSLPVAIAGFGYSDNPRQPMHYHDLMRTREMLDPKNPGHHDVQAERKFIEQLISLNLLEDLSRRTRR
jgi:hypothetical protein